MNLTDFYRSVLLKVCEITGVNEGELMKSNTERCANARAILVKTLADEGVTDTETASLTGMTRQGVNKLKNHFHLRSDKWTVKACREALNADLS